MKDDVLKQYISIQTALQREREELVARLRQIEEVLGQTAPGFNPSGPPRRGRKGRGVNSMSLRDAVLQVTSLRPMTKQEVYEAVQRLGYRFGGKDPLNSLGVVLYGKNPRFHNENGRFSPVAGQHLNGPAPEGRRGKRTMSAEARERIAAAQRARWAKQKSGRGGAARAKRKMSAEGRARIAAAQRARWAKAKAAS